MIDDHSDPTFCPSCDAPVFATRWFLLNRKRTPNGPYTRLGFTRHPNDIATSRHHDRADGFTRHYCDIEAP